MFDSNHNVSRDINVQITNLNNKDYELIITPNDKWLKSPEILYPITIDPTITITSNGTSPLRDKYTFGSSYYEYLNYIKTGRDSSEIYRSYIELNIGEVLTKPVVTYANLQLDVYNNENYCDNDCQVNLREVKSDVLYSSINGSSTNITNPEIIDYVMVNKNNQNTVPGLPNTTYLWDITKLIQKWKNNFQSIGILELSDDKNVLDEYVLFDSANNTSGVKPMVTIGYVEQSGLNDYWTYHSHSAGNAGVGYVNDYTGNLTFVHNDYEPLEKFLVLV